MAAGTFNPLEVEHELEAAGMERAQAAVLAEAMWKAAIARHSPRSSRGQAPRKREP